MKNKVDVKKVVGCATETDGGITQVKVGAGVGFNRMRRITGYLVGDTTRFNNSKDAELHNRVKHG